MRNGHDIDTTAEEGETGRYPVPDPVKDLVIARRPDSRFRPPVDRRFSLQSSAAIGRKNDLVEKIAMSYVTNNEVPLHIVDECPRSFHIVYLVHRGVPFMNVINRIITTFVETGIVDSWFMHAKPFRPISDYHHPKDTYTVFTMKNVVIAFLCLAIGLAASAAAFVAELVFFRRSARSRIGAAQETTLSTRVRF